MEWLKNLGNGVRAIFGKSTLDIGKVFDTITTKMDDWKFTDEEKSRFNKEAADAMSSFAKETLSESTERAQSRREIARLIIYWYLILSLVGVIFLFIDSEKTKLIIQFADQMYLTIAFITIIAFFFGGYYINQFKSKK